MRPIFSISIIMFMANTILAQNNWQAVGPDDFKQISYSNAFAQNIHLDTNGNAFISYIQGNSTNTNRTFIIKKETTSGWIQYTYVDVSGFSYSLVLNKSGEFYIADDTLIAGVYNIRLRKFDGVSWSLVAPTYSVNSSMRPYISMKLDKNENPTILYSDTSISIFPKVVKWDGTNWIPSGGAIVNTSRYYSLRFDFDSQNNIHVLYYDALNGGYKIKKFDGTNWIVSHTNVPGAADFKIHKDSFYISSGQDGYWGGTSFSNPSASITKFDGTSWVTIAFLQNVNTVGILPLNTSTIIDFDTSGNIYLSGGNTWKINSTSTTMIGAIGRLAIKKDTLYIVDNPAEFARKIRLVKVINNSLIESYPNSIYPFKGGFLSTYALFNRQPQHSFFTLNNNTLCLYNSKPNGYSKYINGQWNSIFINNGAVLPYTMKTDTANDIYYMNSKLPNAFNTDDLRLYKLSSGGNWSSVGSNYIASDNAYSYGSFTIDHNNIPYAAYVDITAFGANRIRVKRFDGSIWTDVSSLTPFISAGASENPIITNDTANNLFVLYKENNLYVTKFDGVNWNTLGIPFSGIINTDYEIAINSLGEPIVAYLQSFSGKLKPVVQKFDGNNWNLIGNLGFSYDEVDGLDLLIDNDTPIIAYRDKSNNMIMVAKFNGTYWGALGSATISRDESSFPHLVKAGNDVYISYFSDGLFVKKNTNDTIVPLYKCMKPVVSTAAVTDSTASTSWSVPVNIVGYEYVLSASPTPPSSNGTFTTNITYFATGLQPNTTYYFYVRTICGIDTSDWEVNTFTTTNTTDLIDITKAKSDLKIYPNPTTNIVYIEQINSNKQQFLELYDLYGRVIETINFSEKTTELDISNLSNGVYFIKNRNARDAQSFKIIKQ